MRPRFLIVATIALLGACDTDASSGLPPIIGGPLEPGLWYVNSANGDTLPAAILTRLVGAAQEVVRLDSASLEIRTDLTYDQRYWTRTFINGVLDRTDVVVDQGTIVAAGSGFRLTSSIRTRAFTLSVPTPGVIATSEQMLFLTDSVRLTAGEYRRTRP